MARTKEEYNEYMRNYMRDYSARCRLKALTYLGGVCVDCGSEKELEIHHIDPSTKSFTLASGWHHSWKKLQPELDKCQILCDTCHKDHHSPDRHPHGDARRYWGGCRCALCTKANSEHCKKYRQSKGL